MKHYIETLHDIYTTFYDTTFDWTWYEQGTTDKDEIRS